MEVTVCSDDAFERMSQMISGHTLGYRRKQVWRVRIKVGRNYFLSSRPYQNEALAKRAAARIQQ